MTTDPTRRTPENTYIIDVHSGAEMARLVEQDQLITRAMGGTLSEFAHLTHLETVLDIACGPAGWALELARQLPDTTIVGVDFDRKMLDYADAQAKLQGSKNVTFRMMDVRGPLDFANDSFDLINARFLFGFMPKEGWSSLVKECYRVLRPGGTLRLTEGEGSLSPKSANERMYALFSQSIWSAGLSFSSSGRTITIAPLLRAFLQEVGCIHIREMPHLLNYSAGTEGHRGWCQNVTIGFRLLQPFLVNEGHTTAEEFESLYVQMQEEMNADDFLALFFFLTALGQKSSKAEEK